MEYKVDDICLNVQIISILIKSPKKMKLFRNGFLKVDAIKKSY